MNYKSILDDIQRIATESNRDPKDITLVTVSKTRSIDEMMLAYKQGCRDFAENRVQELIGKIDLMPSDVKWHLIGTLQRNKVNKVVGRVDLIHSVDTPKLAEAISEVSIREGVKTPILLQVNVSGEESKHGLSPLQWEGHLYEVLRLPGVEISGLMTMAPDTEDQELIQNTFSNLAELQKKWGIGPHLSMGMSQDYPIAIKQGATLIRIGTAIFS
jgi:pyridoxal phosphate enzyme (YggS family)